jgi:hypothetical protein
MANPQLFAILVIASLQNAIKHHVVMVAQCGTIADVLSVNEILDYFLRKGATINQVPNRYQYAFGHLGHQSFQCEDEPMNVANYVNVHLEPLRLFYPKEGFVTHGNHKNFGRIGSQPGCL